MKKFKRIMALVIALAMVLGLMSMTAFADPATGNVSSDPTLEIQSLEENDEVNLYQVMEWVDGTGWRVTDGFAALVAAGDSFCQAIKDIQDNKTGVTLSEADVKLIEALAEGATKIDGDSTEAGVQPFTVPAGGTFTYGTAENPVDPGLYIAIVAPNKAGTLYNPIIVASDFSGANEHEKIDAASANLIRGVAPNTIDVPKKETLTVQKTADDTSHDTGDTVTFTVTTTVPLYSTSYTNPTFKISDTLSANLILNADSIKVYKTSDATKTDLVDGTNVTKATSDITDPADADFQIVFTSNYLKDMTAAMPITITYTATFTNQGGSNVEAEDNTVDVDYSNNPSDTDSYGKEKDETRHYTFTIDGTLFGEDTYKNTEVVKVGLDADGNEITQETTLSNGKTVGALQGAKFALFTSTPTDAQKASVIAAKADGSPIYKNTNYTDGCIVESGEDGRITIAGLDADYNNGDGTTYYLAEIEAPNGYVKDPNVYTVTIKPVFADHEYTDEPDSTLKWTVSELVSYTVEINGKQTASYTFTNDSETVNFTGDTDDKSSKGDTVVGAAGGIQGTDDDNAGSRTGKIQNTQGTALPSTGGIGTTIFYVVGAILVIGAGVILITRRRMDA